MAERELTDRLDELVDAILVRPETAHVPAAPELAALWRIAVDLVDRPHEGFRSRLAAELARRAQTMTQATATSHVPKGLTSLMPYLIVQGADRFIDFAQQAFGAEKLAVYRTTEPDGPIMHAVIRIGDSVFELSDGSEEWPPRPAAIHLYVPDADATYARAMAAGATTLVAPTDMPYGDREADVRDPFGNHWYIGTRVQDGPVPRGMRTITPTLHVKGTDRLIEFIERAFGAEVLDRTAAPDGTVMHAQLRIGEAVLELGEARGFVPAMPASIHYYVEDVDAAYARALSAGATASGPPTDRPYGDRAAEVVDPFGNNWFIATHLGSAAAR
jgi:PhnB protein